MYLTGEVDLPQQVVDAHVEGNLVLFVGAGASMDSPSNLPTFTELARQVARKRLMRDAVIADFGTESDTLLGHLSRDGAPVHALVAEILGNPQSLPNDNHKAIVQIAATSRVPRIVTSNFDDHLACAARDARIELGTKYTAPALPLGREFSGLVHLHGSLEGASEEMVLTDADFGSAYLTEAWAPRFLYPMFSDLVVLFIGYSHTDVVMKYLAVGLRRARGRFALTDTPDDSLWARLDVTPIAYPSHDGSHIELTRALQAWARLGAEGGLERRQRIRDIVSAPPGADRADLDYLARSIRRPDGAAAFIEFAGKEEWLSWLALTPAFEACWSAAWPSGTAVELSRWFAHAALGSPDAGVVALNLIKEKGRLQPQLWYALSHEVSRLPNQDRDWEFRRWTAILLSEPAETSNLSHELVSLLHAATWDRHPRILLQLLRVALTPRLRLETAFHLTVDDSHAPRPPSVTVSWSIDSHWADDAWQNRFLPHISECASIVLTTCEGVLRETYDLVFSYDNADDPFDAISFRRSAVEPHSQDDHREVPDMIIDAIRDCISALCVSDPEYVAALVARWLDDPLQILRRIALWALGSSVPSPDERIDLVVERHLLYAPGTRHEVFTLLADAVSTASGASLQRLFEATVQELPDDEFADRRRYELLHWLVDARPDWAEAIGSLAEIQARHSNWQPSEHPDLDTFMTTGFHEEAQPFDDADFRARLVGDPGAAISGLANFEYSDSWGSGPSREGGLGLLRSAVANSPGNGLTSWAAIEALDFEQDGRDMFAAVLDGWKESPTQLDWPRVLDLIDDPKLVAGCPREISSLLRAGVRVDAGLPAKAFSAALRISFLVWDQDIDAYSNLSSSDPMHEGLNTWPGFLTEFWIFLASRISQNSQEHESALDQIHSRLAAAVVEPSQTRSGPRAMIGNQLAFLFHAFEELVSSTIFDVMSTGDARAHDIWIGYLYHPRIDLRMIARGLPDALIAFTPRLEDVETNLRGQLFSLAFAMADSDSADLDPNEFLAGLLVAMPLSERARALRSLARFMDQDSGAKADDTWRRWLRQLIAGLSGGAPITVDAEQWSYVAACVVALDQNFEDGVRLFTSHPASLSGDSLVLRQLKQSSHPENHPVAVRDLLSHLLVNTRDPRSVTYSLGPIVRRLRRTLGPDALLEMVGRAVAASIPNAADWLDATKDVDPDEDLSS